MIEETIYGRLTTDPRVTSFVGSLALPSGGEMNAIFITRQPPAGDFPLPAIFSDVPVSDVPDYRLDSNLRAIERDISLFAASDDDFGFLMAVAEHVRTLFDLGGATSPLDNPRGWRVVSSTVTSGPASLPIVDQTVRAATLTVRLLLQSED